MTELTARELLLMLYETALDSVDGRFLVNQWCRNQRKESSPQRVFTHCVAIGKVAAPMLQGALDALPSLKQSLLISPSSKITRQLKKNKNVVCLAASHPVPDESSLEAGRELLRFLSVMNENDQLLFLISGGTSSLVEVLADGITLDDIQDINRYLLASGKDIHQINSWRQQFSKIKGGGLLNALKTSAVTQLLISDVKDDQTEFIGSGLLVNTSTVPQADKHLETFLTEPVPQSNNSVTETEIETFIIGNLEIAKQAICQVAAGEGLQCTVHREFLEGDARESATRLFSEMKDAPAGVYVWGGETTVVLPKNPGIGGRNQTLALAFAGHLADIPGLHLLAAGTDGIDGNSNCAGAVVSVVTSEKAKKMGFDIEQELDKANAGVLLMATDDLVRAESNTNVMDVVIAYKSS